VVHSLLGRPHLLLGEYRGPAISFSEGGGNVWAALCGDESDIGIDAAGADEFQREYPFHRVFHTQERQHALRLAGGDLEMAAALLWSVKEAVVKALVRFPIAAGRILWVRSIPQRKMWLSIALLNRRPTGHE
jgi:phosphopantetheinyl transferase (holo-ACP synthase)